MRISCVCHGVTDENLAGRYSGGDEDSLTRQQREQLLHVFFGFSRYDAVFCSPFLRCTETAEGILPRRMVDTSAIMASTRWRIRALASI